MNGSLRDNILLGQPLIRQHYQKVRRQDVGRQGTGGEVLGQGQMIAFCSIR